jgi:predicted transposase YbfD/YdcC
VWSAIKARPVTPKKIGTLPVAGDEAVKRTNEIKMAIPLLDAIDIPRQGHQRGCALDSTRGRPLPVRGPASALLLHRQRQPERVARRPHPLLSEAPGTRAVTVDCAHGRIETRKIWTTSALHGYLDFPHVGQAFAVERDTIEKKTGKRSHEIAYGITSRPEAQADARRVLEINRGHWSIENSCPYLLDWNYDEDRSRIRTDHGPENVTRLRRFAIGVIKSKGVSSVAQTMRN